MTDDVLTRAYADNHHRMTGDFAAALARLVETIRIGLARLHAYQFDAPWRRDDER